jgi:hypothetical protein
MDMRVGTIYGRTIKFAFSNRGNARHLGQLKKPFAAEDMIDPCCRGWRITEASWNVS